MRYSVAVTTSLAMLPCIVSGAPSLLRRDPPSTQEIFDAANQWSSDTARVSSFLSGAEQLRGQSLVDAATAALASENDELNHKDVLDRQFVFVDNPDALVQQANNELVDQHKFKDVVDALQNLVDNGANMSPDDVSQAIQNINDGRCSFVLPSIQAYFDAVFRGFGGVIRLANKPTQCQ